MFSQCSHGFLWISTTTQIVPKLGLFMLKHHIVNEGPVFPSEDLDLPQPRNDKASAEEE